MERRGVSSRRVARGSPVSNARVEDKRVAKYREGKENQNVTAKLEPERRESSKSVLGSRDRKGHEGSTRHDAEQDSALENDNDEEFEEMLKRNQEYFEAAALPMEFEQYFDQRSQGEESRSVSETSLGVNITEHKEVEGGEGRDGVEQDSEETGVELKPKADLNKTVSVHSSPEVEVMGDVETTSEEEEVNGTGERYVETRKSLEEKVKKVKEEKMKVAKQGAANLDKKDRLERELKALLQVLACSSTSFT